MIPQTTAALLQSKTCRHLCTVVHQQVGASILQNSKHGACHTAAHICQRLDHSILCGCEGNAHIKVCGRLLLVFDLRMRCCHMSQRMLMLTCAYCCNYDGKTGWHTVRLSITPPSGIACTFSVFSTADTCQQAQLLQHDVLLIIQPLVRMPTGATLCCVWQSIPWPSFLQQRSNLSSSSSNGAVTMLH